MLVLDKVKYHWSYFVIHKRGVFKMHGRIRNTHTIFTHVPTLILVSDLLMLLFYFSYWLTDVPTLILFTCLLMFQLCLFLLQIFI
jgi:hypothetical protein